MSLNFPLGAARELWQIALASPTPNPYQDKAILVANPVIEDVFNVANNFVSFALKVTQPTGGGPASLGSNAVGDLGIAWDGAKKVAQAHAGLGVKFVNAELSGGFAAKFGLTVDKNGVLTPNLSLNITPMVGKTPAGKVIASLVNGMNPNLILKMVPGLLSGKIKPEDAAQVITGGLSTGLLGELLGMANSIPGASPLVKNLASLVKSALPDILALGTAPSRAAVQSALGPHIADLGVDPAAAQGRIMNVLSRVVGALVSSGTQTAIQQATVLAGLAQQTIAAPGAQPVSPSASINTGSIPALCQLVFTALTGSPTPQRDARQVSALADFLIKAGSAGLTVIADTVKSTPESALPKDAKLAINGFLSDVGALVQHGGEFHLTALAQALGTVASDVLNAEIAKAVKGSVSASNMTEPWHVSNAISREFAGSATPYLDKQVLIDNSNIEDPFNLINNFKVGETPKFSASNAMIALAKNEAATPSIEQAQIAATVTHLMGEK